jgi:hypothetical protein
MPSISGSTFTPRLRTASFDAPASRIVNCQISMAAATGARKKSIGDLKKADLQGKKVRFALLQIVVGSKKTSMCCFLIFVAS